MKGLEWPWDDFLNEGTADRDKVMDYWYRNHCNKTNPLLIDIESMVESYSNHIWNNINPFQDSSNKLDPRWKWRTQFEAARNDVRGRPGKHLVKIGCPKHDLLPILQDLNYMVSPAICTHKSHACPDIHNDQNVTV